MSKTYILEPVELEFDSNGNATISPAVLSAEILSNLVVDETFMQIGEYVLTLKNISVDDTDEKTFVYNNDTYAYVIYSENHGDITNLVSVCPMTWGVAPSITVANGTYTVSIYTETEDDSDPKPYIDEKLSKNVTYTDHPHNNWEEVLSKKGDPKTGYNTIEKIANASSEGGSGSSSGGAQIIYATVTTEDGQTYTCDHDGMELIQAVKDGNLVVIVDCVYYMGSAIATYFADDNMIRASILMQTNSGVQGSNISFEPDLAGNYRWLVD